MSMDYLGAKTTTDPNRPITYSELAALGITPFTIDEKIADYSMTASDVNKDISYNSASARIHTIPAGLGLTEGSQIIVTRRGAGAVTITWDASVTVNNVTNGSVTLGPSVSQVVIEAQEAANTFVISGQLDTGAELASTKAVTDANSTYPDGVSYGGNVTWTLTQVHSTTTPSVTGRLTGFRNGTSHSQRLQSTTGTNVYNRYWNNAGGAWSAWAMFIDTGEIATSSLTANQAVTNSVTVLTGASITAPANYLQVGMTIEIDVFYRFVKTTSPPTLTITLSVAGAAVATLIITSVSSATTSSGRVNGVITIVTIGAAGTLMSALFCSNDHGITSAINWNASTVNIATSAIDTTAAKTFSVEMKMTTAVASNTLTISQGFAQINKI